MFKLRNTLNVTADDMLTSRLFDQDNFYSAFIDDLNRAKSEVIIESPFITSKRIATLLPIFKKLRARGIRLVINTKPPEEHEFEYCWQAEQAIIDLQKFGVVILFTGGHHRKLAVIDKQITWEGSLNILSQNSSCEFMRRIYSEQLANQMISFLRIEKFIS